MAEVDLTKIASIVKKIVRTEKSISLQSSNQVLVAVVNKDCRKQVIKSLFSKAFGVEVISVNVMNYAQEKRRFKGVSGMLPSYKKAMIKFASEVSIDSKV